MDLQSVALEAIPKALVYVAVIVSIGVCGARLLLLGHVRSTIDTSALGRVESGLARAAVWSGGAMLLGLVWRAWAHTAVSFGVAQAFSFESLYTIAWDSQWGESWRTQLAGATTLVVFAWAVRQLPGIAWTLYELAAVAMCFALPLLGHAAGEPARVLLHGSHVLAAGVWVGTLTVMAVATPRDIRHVMLRAFAPFAFTGSFIVGVSGLVSAWLYLQSPANAVATMYGWILALKLFFVADVATFGFLNWRRFHRGAAGATSTSALDLHASEQDVFVYLEVAMASIVILITAVLTEVEHPGSN